MAGNANSGRKSWIKELESKEVDQLAIATIKSLLKRNDLTIDQQIKLSLPLVLKRMPDRVEIDDVNALTYEDKIKMLETLGALMGQRRINAPDA